MHTKFFSFLIIFILSACSEISPDENIALAQKAYDSKDYPSSNIYLKKAIQKEPNNIEARILLAKTYQAQGSFNNADKEWTKAIELGGLTNNIIQGQLITLYALDDNLGVVNLWNDSYHEINSMNKLQTMHIPALSLFKLNKLKDSKLLLQDASEQAKGTEYKDLFDALNSLLYSKVSMEEKITKLEHVSKRLEFDLPLKLTLANLYFISQNFESSAEIYEEIAFTSPKYVEPIIIAIESLLRQPNLEKAEKHVENLLSSFPDQPYVNQLAAHIKVQQNDFKQAKKHIDVAILNGQQNPQLRLLAGLTHFKLTNYEQAESYLDGLEKFYSKNKFVKKLIVSNKLKLGSFSNLTNVIDNKDDIELLSATGLALIGIEPDESSKLLQQLNLNDIENISSRNRMGIAKLMSRDKFATQNIIKGAQEVLDKPKASDEEIESSKFLLISSLMKDGKITEAKAIIAEWRKREPNNIFNLLVLGNIIQNESPEKSAALYKEVIKIDKNNQTALLKLGQHYLTLKDYKKAQNHFENIVQQNNYKPQALFGLYKSIEYTENKSEALIRLESMILSNDKLIKNQSLPLLARIYLLANEPQKVISLLSSPQEDKEPNTHLLIAEAYFQLKDYEKTISLYDQIIQEQLNIMVVRKKLSVHDTSNTEKQAIIDLKKLLKQNPNNFKLAIIAANYSVDNNESALGLELLKDIDVPTGYQKVVKGITARAHYFQKNYSEALPILKEEYKATKNNELASFIFNTLKNSNKNIDATSFMISHLKSKPDDINNKLLLANQSFENRKIESIELYKEVLLQSPNNIIALNNLAWLLYEQKKLDEAKLYAAKALDLLPDNQNIIDTYNKINEALQK
jgi:putative PEP-CTERM system TPR-repeat lipoprotein